VIAHPRVETARAASRHGFGAEVSAGLAIAQRDFTKLFRDRSRILTDVLVPVVVFGILGGMLNFAFGRAIGYDFLIFVLTGVFAQSLWQSTALGMVFLLEDRENDFSQEIFVSPVSRYTIALGKILGETLVALPQGLSATIFLLILGFRPSLEQVLALLGVALIVCLLGGTFGLFMLGFIPSRRVAQQIFGFVILPQYFLAGVFNPLQGMPAWLDAVSHLAPLRYAVDLARNVFYAGRPEAGSTVVDPAALDVAVILLFVAVFLPVGTALFVRAERNR
jgi:ABC-2 type transport system permease protein